MGKDVLRRSVLLVTVSGMKVGVGLASQILQNEVITNRFSSLPFILT